MEKVIAMDEQWQPIETAPKDGTDVLLVGIYGDLTATPSPYVGWYSPPKKRWINTYSGKEQYSPSHWMPLPPPPAQQSDDRT